MADVTDRAVRVGCRIPHSVFEQDARALRAAVARAEAVGLDHVCMGDQVSFHGVNLAPVAATPEEAIDVAAEVAELVRQP